MADKQEINKERADSKRYYNLLMSKVGQIKNGDNILLVHIGNLDVIRKIVDNYPEGNYIIIDKKCYGPVLSLLYPFFQEEKRFITTAEDNSIIEALQSLTMKFDKIIMNPPYGKNLHLKILEEALKHLSQDGHCVNLSPVRWLQDPLAKYKKSSDLKKFEESVAKHIEDLDVILSQDARSIFGAVFTFTLGLYKIQKENNMNLYEKINANSILDKVVSLILKTNQNLKNVQAVKSPERFAIIMSAFTGGSDGRADNVRGMWPKQIKNDDFRKKVYFTHGKNAAGETLLEYKMRISAISHVKPKDEVLCIEFNSAIERENFYNSYETNFLRYVFKLEIVDVNIHYEFLPWMGDCINPRTGLKGYLSEWTDEDFYKYFGITEEEQKLIEETMEKNK